MALPERIELGWRTLQELPGVCALGDWESCGLQWRLPLRASSAQLGEFIPTETHWWLVVDGDYPQGDVTFYPDAISGLKCTFQHQSHNGTAENGEPYRTGNPCLTLPTAPIATLYGGGEPTRALYRLRWHGERLLEWLELAAADGLALKDAPFELPDLPLKDSSRSFGFFEDADSYSTWEGTTAHAGVVDLCEINKRLLFATAFRTDADVIFEPAWGSIIHATKSRLSGVWLRFETPCIQRPWQYPETLGDLIQVAHCDNLDALEVLRKQALMALQRGQEWLPVLLGFPVPRVNGGATVRLHWQLISLKLSSKLPKGARRGDPRSLWTVNRAHGFAEGARLQYFRSENLNPEEIATRGRLPDTLTNRRFVIIGAGALGSAVAENLVRAGALHLKLIDHERLTVKNLVRHQLNLNAVGKPKASRLALHLQALNPNASIEGYDEKFPPRERTVAYNAILEADVIINATASDQVGHDLGLVRFEGDKAFISVSLGWRAQKLFFYGARSKRFPNDRYSELLAPYLERERSAITLDDFPWEGIGCHHPVFPARHDDVQLMAASAVKLIEEYLESGRNSSLCTLSQNHNEGRFGGIVREETA